MNTRQKVKIVHEGQYIAEVKVQIMDTDDGWSPSLSLEDAYKLDDVRAALRAGDLRAASKYGRIYELRPIDDAQESA